MEGKKMSAGKCFPAWRVVKHRGDGSLTQPGQWAECVVPQGNRVPWDTLGFAGELLRSTELPRAASLSAAMNTAVDLEDFSPAPASNSQAAGTQP